MVPKEALKGGREFSLHFWVTTRAELVISVICDTKYVLHPQSDINNLRVMPPVKMEYVTILALVIFLSSESGGNLMKVDREPRKERLSEK